ALARLVPQVHVENLTQLVRRAFDRAGTDVLEQMCEHLFVRFGARRNPADRRVACAAEALADERGLADGLRAAQEQTVNLACDELVELGARIAHRVRREHWTHGVRGKWISL